MLKELARKKKQKVGGSESDKKPLGRPPGRKDAAKRVRRTEAEQQRDAVVTAGLVNALGGTQPPQKPEQLVLDGREPRGGEKRKQLFVAALFASFVCCSQMTNRSLRFINAVYLKLETEKGGGAAAAAERKRQGSSSIGSICADTQTGKQQQQQMQSSNAAAANLAAMILITHCP